jgi:hypothetical protein
MKTIIKKIWPDKFDLDKGLNLDFRLGDFDLEAGDRIIFREWNPDTKEFTGREYTKIVKQAIKSESPARYWTPEQMKEHGMWLLEYED